ncbi:hypothetical protein GST45_00025 [Serratia marcescens]|uniref:Uncharacterized protein n=3 Tax=Serratia marcescens TaxID=615 RepID=A0ABD5BD58_SERMA|nr:hypothetical protein [Serratia marcescens]MDE5238443.1 hypothetical protein [Serratia marcescens]MDE5256582.1 hypothetical protein [Serratia marcescens]MDQ9380357.1 hypothetical protein [Serratia marcescens]MDQ9401767.1 hypothetical protein [Serratia marcescens]MDQ9426041.1 hypothetical protein [Serratia marcescens]
MTDTKNTRFDDVEDIAQRLASGRTLRKSLIQQASRFRKNGRHDLANNIKEALALELDQYPQFTAQALRLQERASQMTAEERLQLRVTLDFHGSHDILTDVLVAWQSFFSARGMEISTQDVFTMMALNSAAEFEQVTGEPIARQ